MSQQKEAILICDRSKHIIYNTDLNDIDELNPYLHVSQGYLVPALGRREFDGHIYISGATGAGKSYLVRKIVDNDKKNRTAILFTNLKHEDPAFKGMKYKKFDEASKDVNSEWLKRNQENKIMIFDDILKNMDYADYRDKMLEEARKLGTVIICINHKLQDHYNTKVALNDARFVIAFPNTNSGSILRFLKKEMEIAPKEIKNMLDIIKHEGRQCIMHRFSPNFVCGEKSIFKI